MNMRTTEEIHALRQILTDRIYKPVAKTKKNINKQLEQLHELGKLNDEYNKSAEYEQQKAKERVNPCECGITCIAPKNNTPINCKAGYQN